MLEKMKNYCNSIFAVLIGFVVIFIGSVIVPSLILPTFFGPFPDDNNVPFLRFFSDFLLSFILTCLGGFLAAKLARNRQLYHAAIAGILYFMVSASWYSDYGLASGEWVLSQLMLIKVPIAAYIGGILFKKYFITTPEESLDEA